MKIVNRIVSALLAAAAFPFLITQLLFEIVLSISEESLAYTLINLLGGQENMLTNNRLGFQESILSLIQKIAESDGSSDFNIIEKLGNLQISLA